MKHQIKRKIVRIISFIFAVALLTGGLQTDAYAASKRSKACKAYKSFLAKNESKFEVEEGDFYTENAESYKKASSFMILNMNGDKIPELVTYHPQGYKQGDLYVYTYKNGKVTKMKRIDQNCNAAGWYYNYACKKNHLHVEWNGGYMGHHDYVYKITKGKVKLYLEANEDDFAGTKSFKKNGKKISKSAYNSAISGCVESGKSAMRANNSANRKKYCK